MHQWTNRRQDWSEGQRVVILGLSDSIRARMQRGSRLRKHGIEWSRDTCNRFAAGLNGCAWRWA
eukprot:6999557-Prorocentrum_lima.AAC.1